VTGNTGITYQIRLKNLINRRILSKPIFESCYTDEDFEKNLEIDDWDKILHLDVLPAGTTGQMAESAARNRLVVETYKAEQEEYGKTIVFVVNIVHNIQLIAVYR